MNEETKQVLRWGKFALIMLFVFLLAETLNGFKAWSAVDSAYNSISVNGSAESITVPDIATFSFSVSSDAKVVSDAQNTVTQKNDAIIAGLKALGVEERDIKTTEYSVYPKYVYSSGACASGYCPPSRQIPDGYTVTSATLVKVRKTADAGKALALVGDKGATNVSGLNFTTDDPDKAQNEARAKAIENAKEKAEELADRLGVRIVRVVGYSDSSQSPGPIFYASGMGGMTKDSAQSAPTVNPGESKTTVNVTVTYEIR